MLKKFRILVIFFICACSYLTRSEIEKINNDKLKFNFEIQKIDIFAGKTKFISIPIPKEIIEGKIVCKDKEIPFTRVKDKILVILQESYFSEEQTYSCYFEYQNEKYEVLKMTVKLFEYPSERIYVDQAKVTLSEKDQKRVEEEQKIMEQVYKNGSPTPLFKSPFLPPLNTHITSHYGNRRVFNQMKKTQHLGTDFRAKVGVHVPSSNTGKVVFTGDLFYAGKTVVVDHGMGIFSIYAHLSKIKVKTGQMVDTKTILGNAGATGRVSGPHLHWGVKINGDNIDGFSLIQETKQIEKFF